MWRSDLGLCEGGVPALEHEDIASMLAEIMPQPDRISEVPGCRSFCITYGEQDSFRLDTLGDPTPHTIILTRLPSDAPKWFLEGIGLYEGWDSKRPKMNWSQLLGRAERKGGDALLLPGCPPCIWSKFGLHAFCVPPLDDDAVCSMIEEIMRPPERRVQRQGIIQFRMRPSVNSEFIAAIFEHPSPTLALLTRYR